MAELAGTIELIISPEGNKVLVNGEEFPFDVLADDIEAVSQPGEVPFVRVSIPASAVLVRADLSGYGSDWKPIPDKPEGYRLGDKFTMTSTTPEPDPTKFGVQQLDVDPSDESVYLMPGTQGGWSWSETPTPVHGQWSEWSRHRDTWVGEEFQIVKCER